MSDSTQDKIFEHTLITRKHINNDLLTRLEATLEDYFDSTAPQNEGVPSVAFVADKLNVSPNYLSDLLKNLTGKTAQQYIHLALIAKGKEYLSTTSLTVSEIAFLLGFEHSQSFSRIFKKRLTAVPSI